MNEGFDRAESRYRLRPLVAGAAVILGAATMLACGDSSDKATGDTTTAKPAASASATTSAPEPTDAQKAQAAATAAENHRFGTATDKAVARYKVRHAEGTVRLAATPIGTKGTLQVQPAGAIAAEYEHWYKPGTSVTVRAKDTKVARFAEWAGACTGKSRTCKIKVVGDDIRLIAGFTLDEAAAAKLSPDDPALKPALAG